MSRLHHAKCIPHPWWRQRNSCRRGCCAAVEQWPINCRRQGCSETSCRPTCRVASLQSWSNSRTFPWIFPTFQVNFTEYRRLQQQWYKTKCMLFLTANSTYVFSHNYDNYVLYPVKNSLLAYFTQSILVATDHMQEHIFPNFLWPLLNSPTFPCFPGKWPPCTVWVKKIPPPLRPAVFGHFWQTVENFKSFFTHLLYVPIR